MKFRDAIKTCAIAYTFWTIYWSTRPRLKTLADLVAQEIYIARNSKTQILPSGATDYEFIDSLLLKTPILRR